PPARTLQNAIIDSQQVEKKEGRKQTEILLKKDFDVEVGLKDGIVFSRQSVSFHKTMRIFFEGSSHPSFFVLTPR
ncbi:MAG: hypothetical protein U0K28_06495, partial [Prevotellamassilia sp.]|nr:hypothetical protein [Prevotellamassilia sp.]